MLAEKQTGWKPKEQGAKRLIRQGSAASGESAKAAGTRGWPVAPRVHEPLRLQESVIRAPKESRKTGNMEGRHAADSGSGVIGGPCTPARRRSRHGADPGNRCLEF
jgi:hypothetical protein